MNLVHLIPESVFNNTYHGSYKDTISRVRFLGSSGRPYHQIRLTNDDSENVLRDIPLDDRSAFLIEYSTFPNIVRTLRQRFPQAYIAVRSHNLEPLQHLDNYGWWPEGKSLPWMLYGMGRLLYNDMVVKRHASVIWSISDWENRVYWNRLPGRATVAWLPYHCPDHLLPDPGLAVDCRRRIVCMPTSQKNRKSWDLVTRFISFAEQMRRHTGDRYEYLITGNLKDWGLPISNAVTCTGMIEDLRAFLPTVKAVSLLSDKGYGFKTTIGDAIAHGALVLAHPSLRNRCPSLLGTAVYPADTSRLDVGAVAAEIDRFESGSHLDGDLRSVQQRMMSQLLAVTGDAAR